MIHWILVILRLNAVFAIGIMGVFSLIMVAILLLKGYLALFHSIFSGVGKIMNPVQKPQPIAQAVPKVKLLSAPRTLKECYECECGIWEVVGSYRYRDQYPISDLTPETENLLKNIWDVFYRLMPYRKPIEDGLKAQGITHFFMRQQILRTCLLENPDTRADQEQLDSYITALTNKIKGGNQLC